MERKFKHKLTNKILVIGGQTGESMLRFITGKHDGITLSEIITNSNEWQEVVEYPIGTKVHNSQTNTIYTKQVDGWYKPAEKTAYNDEMISSKKFLTVLGNSKEVVEKDYEILSFKHKGSNHIWKNDSQLKDTFCIVDGKAPFTSLEEINKYPKVYHIHSIRRVSDGEIFTIGDKVNELNMKNHSTDIKSFSISNDYLYANSVRIDSIQHIKKPLFTTEDGVDIYKGDSYCKVNNHSDYSIIAGFVAEGAHDNYKGLKFSTKEAAEEYIIFNKPCLSINDLENIKITYGTLGDSLINKAKKLVKSKL